MSFSTISAELKYKQKKDNARVYYAGKMYRKARAKYRRINRYKKRKAITLWGNMR